MCESSGEVVQLFVEIGAKCYVGNAWREKGWRYILIEIGRKNDVCKSGGEARNGVEGRNMCFFRCKKSHGNIGDYSKNDY